MAGEYHALVRKPGLVWTLLATLFIWSPGVFAQEIPLLMGSVAMDVPAAMVSRLTP